MFLVLLKAGEKTKGRKMPRVVILDCGSSFVRNLFNKLKDFQVLPVMVPSDTPAGDVLNLNPIGIFITGSPYYVNDPLSPQIDTDIYDAGVPILGICYGLQRMAVDLGGTVKRMAEPERECVHLYLNENNSSILYRDFTEEGAPVWMSHSCKAVTVPDGFLVTGETDETVIASMEDIERRLYAVQYHPEHKGKDPASQAGTAILWSFLEGICGHQINN
jgi:GMP synthase (glutamine-hydrolysing)